MKLRNLLELKADEICEYFKSQPKTTTNIPYNIELHELYTNPPDSFRFRKANIVKKVGFAIFYTSTAVYRNKRLRRTIIKKIILIGPHREVTIYFDIYEELSGIQDKEI